VFDGNAGDEAVGCGADRHPGPTAAEVDQCGLFIAFDRVLRMVEPLGAEVLRRSVELIARGDALDDLLKDGARKPDRIAPVQYLREAPRDLGLRPSQVVYPDRAVYKVQGYFPSRSRL
jgi:hypothetical protein